MHTFYFTINYAIHVLVHVLSYPGLHTGFLFLPRTASVERSFSYMKLIKTHLCNTDQNLGRLMRIAIEGPDLSAENFQVLEIKINKERKEELSFVCLFFYNKRI